MCACRKVSAGGVHAECRFRLTWSCSSMTYTQRSAPRRNTDASSPARGGLAALAAEVGQMPAEELRHQSNAVAVRVTRHRVPAVKIDLHVEGRPQPAEQKRQIDGAVDGNHRVARSVKYERRRHRP